MQVETIIKYYYPPTTWLKCFKCYVLPGDGDDVEYLTLSYVASRNVKPYSHSGKTLQ